jgi:5-(carboxyamino)imidazole ribonucleotide synthase
MLARAAADLGVGLHVQTPNPGDPAVSLAASVVAAPLDDVEATRRLASRCQVISFENEWVSLDALEALRTENIRFLPDLDALRPLVSKRSQRDLLNRLALPCPRWCPLEAVFPPPPGSEADLAQVEGAPDWSASREAEQSPGARPPAPPGDGQYIVPRLPEGFRFPVIAKAVSGGYDGKGTTPLRDQAALEELLGRVDPAAWILEELVAFERELAMVACRDQRGIVACYPLVETHQHHQVCDWVLFPAPVDHAVLAFARNTAVSVLTALEYVGVLSIEFFYGPAGLQVNELAPRTHNSGHLTIEACRCSQFEQQVRIVAGLPMGPTDPVLPGALMVNLLGYESAEQDYYAAKRRALEALPGAHLHWYGKPEATPGRKLGHLTVALEAAGGLELAAERDRRLAEVRALWPLPPDPLE